MGDDTIQHRVGQGAFSSYICIFDAHTKAILEISSKGFQDGRRSQSTDNAAASESVSLVG